jgi:hypothetical protein
MVISESWLFLLYAPCMSDSFWRGSVVRGIDAEDWRSCGKARDLFYGGSLREFDVRWEKWVLWTRFIDNGFFPLGIVPTDDSLRGVACMLTYCFSSKADAFYSPSFSLGNCCYVMMRSCSAMRCASRALTKPRGSTQAEMRAATIQISCHRCHGLPSRITHQEGSIDVASGRRSCMYCLYSYFSQVNGLTEVSVDQLSHPGLCVRLLRDNSIRS